MNSIYNKKISSWRELESLISSLETNKAKGDAFEYFAYAYFSINSHLYNVKNVFMQRDIPSTLRNKYKLEITDNGVDGVIETEDNKIIAYQVKFRSDNSYADYSELATFWAESEYCESRCIFSNSFDLPKQTEKKKNQFSILLDSLLSLKNDFFDSLYEFYISGKIRPISKFKPKDHQAKIISDVIQGFKTYDRGKVISACGTGKTLTSLWIKEELKANTTLFIVPSLALIKQSLNQWVLHSNQYFKYLCVCSDITVNDEIDEETITERTSMFSFPVTTSPTEITSFLKEGGHKVVFSTYHSLDSIVQAMTNLPDFSFDLAIFDEAHRTAGSRDSSMFTLGMNNQFIPIKKRLFMTATERVVSPRLRKALIDTEYEVFSMDDPDKYGPIFSYLSFGKAIEKGIISDYKILLSAVTVEDVYESINKNHYVSIDSSGVTTSENLLKQVVMSKAISSFNIKKIVSYHRSVEASKSYIYGGKNSYSLDLIVQNFVNLDGHKTFYSHIDGTMNSAVRSGIFENFTKSDIAVMSNAKCLTEGVDLPIIDAVMFSDPKKSVIDIIQAIGRALRISKDKENMFSYIILPIVLPNANSSFSEIPNENFETLHNVVQALRDQDERLADQIDLLNLNIATTGKTIRNQVFTGLQVSIPEKVNLADFQDGLVLRIAEINKNPTKIMPHYILTLGPRGRESGIKRVFRTIGDYNPEAYGNNLVLPTLRKFSDLNKIILPNKDIAFNHNNVSHSIKFGAITKEGKNSILTLIGKKLINSPNQFNEIFKRQLLCYYDISEESNETIFPYRAFLKIMMGFDYLNRFEFLYSIYSMKGTKQSNIDEAIARIKELRQSYYNIDILSEENKIKILKILNEKYFTNFSFADVWTTKTTSYNQFNYFKNHIQLFTNIFKDDDKYLIIKKYNVESEINKILLLDESVENMNKDELKKYYIELKSN